MPAQFTRERGKPGEAKVLGDYRPLGTLPGALKPQAPALPKEVRYRQETFAMLAFATAVFWLAATPAAAQVSPCSQNKELEAVALRLQFTPDSGAPLDFRFRFSSCRVETTDDRGNRIPAQAVRAYFDSAKGYGLAVTTLAGASASSVVLVQQIDSGYMVAGTLGSHASAQLAAAPIDLGPVTIADFRGNAKVLHGTATLKPEK